jgi:hypothetical protein
MTKVTLIRKRGNTPTQISSQIVKPLFCYLWKTLQFEATVSQLRTFHMNLHHQGMWKFKNRTVDVKDIVWLGVVQVYSDQLDSFAHRDQQKICLGYVAPKPRRWQMSSRHLEKTEWSYKLLPSQISMSCLPFSRNELREAKRIVETQSVSFSFHHFIL